MRLSYEVFGPDVAVLTDFYVRVLRFEPVGGMDDHVVLERGSARVACCLAADAAPVDRRPPHGPEIVLRVPDVELEHEHVLSTGWPLADPLVRRPWGQVDFRLHDPAGVYLRISGDPRAPDAV